MVSITINREDIEKILYDRAERMIVFTGGKIRKDMSNWENYNIPSGFIIEIDRE